MELSLFSWDFWTGLASIIMLDLVLAGDNAVVIAMAANTLPRDLRKKAIIIGTAGAVVIRFLMTLVAVWLLTIPGLQAVGGCILLPIAVKLLAPPAQSAKTVHQARSLWGAVRTILIADAAMGIDNVLAIAGAAGGHFVLVALGLLISVPIVACGSQIIGRILERFPILVYGGAGILGWTAGSMIVHDTVLGKYVFSLLGNGSGMILPALLAAAVCVWGKFLASRSVNAKGRTDE